MIRFLPFPHRSPFCAGRGGGEGWQSGIISVAEGPGVSFTQVMRCDIQLADGWLQRKGMMMPCCHLAAKLFIWQGNQMRDGKEMRIGQQVARLKCCRVSSWPACLCAHRFRRLFQECFISKILGRAPPPAAVESGCNLTIDYFLAAYLVAAKKAGDHLGPQKKIFPL